MRLRHSWTKRRRLLAASEARAAGAAGCGGVARDRDRAQHDRSWPCRSTLRCVQLGDRVRRAGGGGKPATETQPGLLEALNELVQSSIRGDPEAALRWISKASAICPRPWPSAASLPEKLVGRLLRRLGFSLQANSKTREARATPIVTPSSSISMPTWGRSRQPGSQRSRSTRRRRACRRLQEWRP